MSIKKHFEADEITGVKKQLKKLVKKHGEERVCFMAGCKPLTLKHYMGEYFDRTIGYDNWCLLNYRLNDTKVEKQFQKHLRSL